MLVMEAKLMLVRLLTDNERLPPMLVRKPKSMPVSWLLDRKSTLPSMLVMEAKLMLVSWVLDKERLPPMLVREPKLMLVSWSRFGWRHHRREINKQGNNYQST